MDRSPPQSAAAAGDRLSKLEDHVLGRILSFLQAKEAARAALLSSRWRDVFAGVQTVVLEEPERPIREAKRSYGSPGYCHSPADPDQPPPFSNAISAALLARNRRRGGGAPLRALRVAKADYSRTESSLVDQWVSFALQQAGADGLDLDLRLGCHRSLCPRSYALRSAGQAIHDERPPRPLRAEVVSDGEEAVCEVESPPRAASADSDSDDDTSVLSNDDDDQAAGFNYKRQQERIAYSYTYTTTRVIFSCAELRSLSLGFCRLAPPTNVSMPSLEALLLSHVPDSGSDVERLISGCQRLVDLTLEACDAVTTFSVLRGVRLRRLAIRCCHNLVTVTVDSSELRAFEYRGAVPENEFLTLHGGCRKVVYCKMDLCGEEVSSQEDLVKLRQLLQQFANAQYLHLESARLGMGLNNDVPMRFPDLSSLRHLELRGRLPDDDTAVVAAVSRILQHAKNLAALSLVFHPEEDDRWSHEYRRFKDDDLLDAHHLDYNPHSTLAVPRAAIPCLKSHVRKINLVHYQGGTAQRTLAKFLLSNAPVMEELFCELAEGPFWTQTQLMREIKGWVANKSANTHIF